MTKEEISQMSEEELLEAVTNWFVLQNEVPHEVARRLAEEFLEMLFRYRRLTAMLEESLVARITGGR